MPTLDWIGKNAVVKHHKDVPFRLLETDAGLSCGDSDSGNLIVEGDNLHALKALLPRYAGKVKCIYIDPPYNTGNEDWVYNDNVNAPEMKKWLGKTVGKEAEDLTRHDKWLCMMYPRLVLLKQFLKKDGMIFVSIDHNEFHHMRILMDEIFGEQCFKNIIAVRRGIKSVQAQFEDIGALSVGHEYIYMYSARSSARLPKLYLKHGTSKPGKWDTFWRGTDRPTMRYELFGKTPDSGQWRWESGRTSLAIKNYIYFLENISNRQTIDEWFLENLAATNQKLDFVRQNKNGVIQYYIPPSDGKLLSDNWMDILLSGSQTTFETEKNVKVIERIIEWITEGEDIILDSYAGSGTTAHAVVNTNFLDGGNRKFITCQMPFESEKQRKQDKNIARDITAERVRRVIEGYTDAKGKAVDGLGGGFQYCRLSAEPLFDAFGAIRADVTFAQLAEFVWFVETGTGYDNSKPKSPLLGIHEGRAIYLLYNGILQDRKVNGGNVLTSPVLVELPAHAGPKVIYAAANKLGAPRCQREHITFKQTPYALDV